MLYLLPCCHSWPFRLWRSCGSLIRRLTLGRAEIPIITKRSQHAVGGHNLPSSVAAFVASATSADLRDWPMTMKIPRRTFLHLAAGVVALPAVSKHAKAQAYP